MHSARITRYYFSKRRSYAQTKWAERSRRQGRWWIGDSLFDAMFTPSEIDLAQNSQVSSRSVPIAGNLWFWPRHFGLITSPASIIDFQRAALQQSDHSLNIFCRVLLHGWLVVSLGKSTIWIWSYGSCTYVHDKHSPQFLIDCD